MQFRLLETSYRKRKISTGKSPSLIDFLLAFCYRLSLSYLHHSRVSNNFWSIDNNRNSISTVEGPSQNESGVVIGSPTGSSIQVTPLLVNISKLLPLFRKCFYDRKKIRRTWNPSIIRLVDLNSRMLLFVVLLYLFFFRLIVCRFSAWLKLTTGPKGSVFGRFLGNDPQNVTL